MDTTTPENLQPAEREKIFGFLQAHPVAVLATTDTEGGPHASTIYIGVDDSLEVAFTTKRGTRKYQNLAADNRVMLVVHDAAKQAVVQIHGKAAEVSDPDKQSEIYHATLQATKQTGEDIVPPVAKIAAGEYVCFTVDIDNIWMSQYGWGDNFANAMKHADDRPATGDPS